jgi:hypothetical protein
MTDFGIYKVFKQRVLKKYFVAMNFCRISQDVWKTHVSDCTSSTVFQISSLLMKIIVECKISILFIAALR